MTARSQAARKSVSSVQTAGGLLQRRCACGQHTGGAECPRCRQSHSSPSREDLPVPSIVRDVLRSGGQPLEADTLEYMESRFGRDFSHVRVHTGPPATEAARAIDADAFAAGEDIFFARGNPSSNSPDARRFLAHELAHVVQSYEGKTGGPLRVSNPGDPLELEADRRASQALASKPKETNLPPLARATGVLPLGPLLRQRAPKTFPEVKSEFNVNIDEGTLSLVFNGVEIAKGTTTATTGDGFNIETQSDGRHLYVKVDIPRQATMKFVHPDADDTLKSLATYFRGEIIQPGLAELSWEIVDSIESPTPGPKRQPPAAQRPATRPSPEAVSAEMELDFPLQLEDEDQAAPTPVGEDEGIPGFVPKAPIQVSIDKSRPDLLLVPGDATREEIASVLFGDASATGNFAFDPTEAPPAADGTPRRRVRVVSTGLLKDAVRQELLDALEKELTDDVQWTIAKLSEAFINDQDEWELTERAMRWSQRSEVLDPKGENYFDRYLDALAAVRLKQPHWYTLTLTSTTHTALDWLLIETEEKSDQIKKVIALRSWRWQTGYKVVDASPVLAQGNVVGRFYWSTGSGVRILMVTTLADESTLDRAEIRTRNNTVWAGMKIIVPGKDGRFHGYAVQFDTILGSVQPLDDPNGHFAWYYPGTIFIRPGETRPGVSAGTGELRDLRQSILDEALSKSTAAAPWPMLGLDYDVLDLLTIEQRVDVFNKVINGPGLNDELGIAFLGRVLASTPNSAFPQLERSLTDKGVLDKLLRSNSPGKVQLGQAFTIKALSAFPLSVSSLETMPSFDVGKEGTTRYTLDVQTEKVSTTLVAPAQLDPTKGVSLGAEPALPGETPGPVQRTALRFKPVVSRQYGSTAEVGKPSRPLHPLELVRVEIHGPQPQTRVMTAMELAMIASVPDTAAIWEAIGRISTMYMFYGGVAGLTKALAAPVLAETALAEVEGGAAADVAGAEATAVAARQAAIRQFIGRMLLASSMAVVDTYRDDLSKTEEGRAFLAVYDIAMVALAAHDIYKLASSGMLRELGRRGALLLQQMGAKVSPAIREAIETAQDVQTTIDRLLAEKKIAITPDGVTYNVPNGNETFKQVFFSVRAERAVERAVGGLRGAGLPTTTSEAAFASLQRLAEKSEDLARAFNSVARRAASLPPAEVENYLAAVDKLRSAVPTKAQPALAELLAASGKARITDPVAFLQDAEWLVTRPGIDADALATLGQKTGQGALDLKWLRSTGLTAEDLNFLGKDPKTNWDLFRRAAADPTNLKLQILVRTRLRGIAGEIATERAAGKLFPEFRLTGRQVELEDGHIVDFELTAKDGSGLQHALEVKGWTGDTWSRALKAWEASLEAGAKLDKQQELLVKQLRGVINQLNDATKAPRGKPFLVVTKNLSGPTQQNLASFLRKNAAGTQLRAIDEAEILETTKRLRAALGLPEQLGGVTP